MGKSCFGGLFGCHVEQITIVDKEGVGNVTLLKHYQL